MKLFTLDKDKNLKPYTERSFETQFTENYLEDILEKNPEYFFEGDKILILNRQVTTDSNKFIDLLGMDGEGNAIAIELKRGRTPRETIAQILEYAAFVDKLDYARLNVIFQARYGEENELADYHRQYFEIDPSVPISFNKSVKLVIVAAVISNDIKQSALFLGARGIGIYCIEFKYFETSSGERIITSDFVVGKDDIQGPVIPPPPSNRITRDQFLQSLDSAGRPVFEKLLHFADENGLIITWGTVGFSISIPTGDSRIPFMYGYPPSSGWRQSIYTDSLKLSAIPGSEEIVKDFVNRVRNLGYFTDAGETGINLKWLITAPFAESQVNAFLDILRDAVDRIRSMRSGEE